MVPRPVLEPNVLEGMSQPFQDKRVIGAVIGASFGFVLILLAIFSPFYFLRRKQKQAELELKADYGISPNMRGVGGGEGQLSDSDATSKTSTGTTVVGSVREWIKKKSPSMKNKGGRKPVRNVSVTF